MAKRIPSTTGFNLADAPVPLPIGKGRIGIRIAPPADWAREEMRRLDVIKGQKPCDFRTPRQMHAATPTTRAAPRTRSYPDARSLGSHRGWWWPLCFWKADVIRRRVSHWAQRKPALDSPGHLGDAGALAALPQHAEERASLLMTSSDRTGGLVWCTPQYVPRYFLSPRNDESLAWTSGSGPRLRCHATASRCWITNSDAPWVETSGHTHRSGV
ncbi:unnamed protein product [Diplocarpon coronariae]|nr:hypothetical protein JHW43_007067 [Diplocarpon mali]